ncbi:MAG: subclass B3 metallo-beta-lactamase [Erythrobacter sp.]
MFAKFLPILALAACTSLPADSPPAAMPDPTVMVHATPTYAEACEEWDEWDKPGPPVHILGGTWYVGTCGISAILITDPSGHILIDSGTEKGAEHVLANIRRIGVDPKDIRYILASHEHFDHVGGHALMTRETGAEVIASPEADAVFRSGKVSPDDPQAESGHPDMAPVIPARLIADGETLTLGKNAITAHATPGHTPGAMSYSWTACSLPGEPPVCRRIAYVDSLSAVSSDDYRFTDHPALVASFRETFAKVDALPCDILLTPHPSGSRLIERLKSGNLEPPGQCAAYAKQQGSALDKRLARETRGE